MPENPWASKWDPAEALNMTPEEYIAHVDEQLEELTVKAENSLNELHRLRGTGPYAPDENNVIYRQLKGNFSAIQKRIEKNKNKREECVARGDAFGISAYSDQIKEGLATLVYLRGRMNEFLKSREAEPRKIQAASEKYFGYEIERQSYEMEQKRIGEK